MAEGFAPTRGTWPTATLGSVLARSEYGTSAKVTSDGTREIVGMKNLVDGVVDVSSLSFVHDDPKMAPLVLRPGDVLINRTNSADRVGKVGIVRSRTDAVFASYLVRLVPNVGVIDPEFLLAVLHDPPTQQRIRKLATRGVSQANVNPSVLKRRLRVPVPPLPEQRKITAILRTWDGAIEGARDELRLVRSIYEATQETFVGGGDHRLALGGLTRQLSTRNVNLKFDRQRVMGVSNKHGIVPMRLQTIGSTLTRYQVLPPRAFAYNPMRIDVGSIAMSRLRQEVIVSPDYVLFECDERRLVPEFLDHVIETKRWRHDVRAGASGSVRSRTYYDDLASIRIGVPPVETQRRVVNALDSMRAEIALLDHKIELLRAQKRGLMQKLLSGDIRVPSDDEEEDT